VNVDAPVAGAAVRVHDGKLKIKAPNRVRIATPMKATRERPRRESSR
jgi:hypothetical protein